MRVQTLCLAGLLMASAAVGLQFTQLDMEMAFMSSDAIMAIAETLIASVLHQVLLLLLSCFWSPCKHVHGCLAHGCPALK